MFLISLRSRRLVGSDCASRKLCHCDLISWTAKQRVFERPRLDRQLVNAYTAADLVVESSIVYVSTSYVGSHKVLPIPRETHPACNFFFFYVSPRALSTGSIFIEDLRQTTNDRMDGMNSQRCLSRLRRLERSDHERRRERNNVPSEPL